MMAIFKKADIAPSLTLPLEGEGSEHKVLAGGGVLHRTGKNIYFTSAALSNAKRLRHEMTETERRLWYKLRGKRLGGFRFRKQVPVGSYIADFVCFEHKLVIELDGGQHALQQNYDKKRDEFLKEQGFRILRFWNNEVMENMEGMLLIILRALQNPALPNPSPKGGEGL
jgi:very-short-patch-repair endonuclease